MEFTILPENICRTCLTESDNTMFMNVQDSIPHDINKINLDNTMFMNIQDLIEHDMNKVKLIDILVYLNCVQNNDEENWPQGMCASCVSTALSAYNFKLSCLRANTTLSQILTIQSSPAISNVPRSDLDSIDINVVYQDHEYEVPLLGSQTYYDFEAHLRENSNKEVTPLPPVTEITSTEQPPRKEGNKKYTCTLCPRSFTRIYGLKYHMAKHNNIRKFLCSKCGKSFHTSNGLKQHLLSHSTSQFKCGFCNKTYKARQSLKEHFRTAHSNNRHLFVCVACGKCFTAKSTLVMHTKIHEGVKPYACPHCPRTYTRASYLRAHSLVHSGIEKPKPFSCYYQECDRKFSTKHSLQVHIAHTHTNERPHKCSICLKGFVTLSGLKIHRESHSNCDITCNICNKKFSCKRSLQKHIKVHDVDTSDMILETVVDNIFFDQVY